jgi:hypothetical protein
MRREQGLPSACLRQFPPSPLKFGRQLLIVTQNTLSNRLNRAGDYQMPRPRRTRLLRDIDQPRDELASHDNFKRRTTPNR